MAKSSFDRRWGSKDLRAGFCGGDDGSGEAGAIPREAWAVPGGLPGRGVHLPNAGGPFTKMGGPYTGSHLQLSSKQDLRKSLCM